MADDALGLLKAHGGRIVGDRVKEPKKTRTMPAGRNSDNCTQSSLAEHHPVRERVGLLVEVGVNTEILGYQL